MSDADARMAVHEQIAMYLTALPCPPLPVRVSTQGGEQQLTTSHDLLAGLLILAMQRNNQTLNKRRLTEQKRLIEELIAQLDRLAHQTKTKDVGDEHKTRAEAQLYQLFVRFTSSFIYAFHDTSEAPRIDFVAWPCDDCVDKGSKLHAAACSYSAAQDIIYMDNPNQRRKAQDFASMTYGELLSHHLDRSRDGNDRIAWATPSPSPSPSAAPVLPLTAGQV